jgi:aminopeptidase-like protein
MAILDVLENIRFYLNQSPECEPQVGKRGLYRKMGGQAQANDNESAMLWVLNFSDGDHSLLDIAERSGLPFSSVRQAAHTLLQHHLLEAQPNQRSQA